MFSVRLVSTDSYQAQPLPQLDPTFSEFRGSEIKHVPIIRIFGCASNGEKTCLHIHGVFPYLYVPYTGEEDPSSLSYRLAASLDAAINVSLGSATSKTQHVYLIQRVSGIPFYGYHRKEHQYLKIYFYNPAMIKRAADLLQNGSVLNQSLQPHEAHIPYILQFMIDYNVYGMSLVNLSGVKHRRLTQTLAELTSSGQSVASENSEIEYLPATIERQSTCEIEIDALASDIMNRREIERGLDLNPGLAAIWDEERARRAQAGLQGGDSQLVNPKSPPRPTFRPTDNDIYQEQRLARRLLFISQCDESSLSTTTNQSVAYAAEVQEGENLLNSSHLPFSRPTAERNEQLLGREDSTLHATIVDFPTEVASQRMTPECSILGTEDMPLIDLLVQLAGEGAENEESVDMDSLLGSQVSALLNDEKNDNEDDEDAVDLNLTSLQLDSLSSLEIAAEQGNEPAKSDRNSFSTIDFIPSYESLNSSRSGDEEKTRKGCRVPQYDGAGDVSPTLLNSDDEDNGTNAKEFSHLPEYNGNCEFVSKYKKIDHLEQNLKTSSNNAPVASKDNDKSGERCSSSSPVDAAIDSSPLLPALANDAYLAQYNGLSYEPFDRLLEIGPEFVPDLEGLHSSMEIGILLSSADSDSPESVDEALEDDAIPLETVLNGDPCFTESAELDKSDLTELQDQYVSLLGNSLLPDVHTNLRIDSDLGNSSNISDSDYQTGEKPCETLLNLRSPRSSITSRESSSSSENVAPNIQEPEARGCSRGKFNVSYAIDRESRSSKDSARISTDNSDYNCNVVATWAELQNLQFVGKEKMDERLGRSRERGQYSQGPRQSRRKASRRSDERAASQILRLDSEKILNSTATLAPLQVSNNCPVSPRKIVASSETESSMQKSTNSTSSPIVAEVTVVETRLTESLVDVLEGESSGSPRVPNIAAEVEIEQQPSFDDPEASARLDAFHRSIIGSDIRSLDAQDSFPATCGVGEGEGVVTTVDFEELSDNWLGKFDEPLRTKEIPKGSSYYSSQRSNRDYTVDGSEHRHCQFSKYNKIVQDEVFTSDQVWVIEKQKRGRQTKWRYDGVCSSGNCGVPIVPLKKIDGKSDENATVIENSEKIEDTDLPVDESTAEPPRNQLLVSSADPTVEKSNLPRKRAVTRKSRIRRKRIDSSSSDSNENVASSSFDSCAGENENDTIDEAIDAVLRRNGGETKDPESSDWAEDQRPLKESFSPGEVAHNPYGMRRRYSRKKRSIVRNSKKLISTRASKITRNGVRRRVSRAAKHKEDNLPGIPGIVEYRSSRQQSRSKIDAFSCYNGVASDNKTTETSRKTKNKLQSVLLTNWEHKREVSSRRTNGLVNSVQNGFSDNRKTVISPDRRTINSSQFDFPPVSPIPKRNRSLCDSSKDLSHLLNRSSTPKKINSEICGSNDEKFTDIVTLNSMMREVKSRSTRAKLKILLEKRKNNTTSSFTVKETKATTERSSLSTEERLSETKATTPVTPENLELLPISATVDDTKKSIEDEEIDDKVDNDNAPDDLGPSFETVSDVIEKSHKSCESVANSFDVVNNIFASSALNADLCNTEDDEASEIFEAELEVLGNEIPEANPAEELSNERKDLSYQNDQFASTIVEANFFSGNNYTIDAVSLEMPACLFEEDSNSVDKRSPKKTSDSGSQSFNESRNSHDAYSDVSVDPRDLDVYDIESLTPSSSLAGLDEAVSNVPDTSFNMSEATESSLIESLTNSETRSISTCREKSQGHSKCEEITADSSFEEASPEFEALSPSPHIFDLGKSAEEEFTVHSTVEIAENGEKLNNSCTNTADDSLREARRRKMRAEEENSQLDHEIQDLVSQVVVHFENESHLPCESESGLIIEISPPNISERREEIAAGSEIQKQRIEEPEALTRTEREKGLPIAAEENERIFCNNESMASATSETNGELQAPAEGQKTFAKETDCEFFDIIKNKAQSVVHESRREFQQTVTRELELIDKSLESKDENKQLTASLEKKQIESDKNYLDSESDNRTSNNEELVNISKDGLPIKPLKCRPVAIKLVNIDLSRFDGFQPKKCTGPNVTELECEQETVGNAEAEHLTEKNILESTPRNIFEENIVNIVPVKLKLKEQTIVEDKATDTCSERVISESTKPIKIPEEGDTFEKIIPIKSTTPTESPLETLDETFEKTIPIDTKSSSQNSTRKRTEKTLKVSRRPKRRSMRKCAEKTRLKLSQQTSSQLSAAESQQSTEENDRIVAENDSRGPESRLQEKSKDLSSHEINFPERELNNLLGEDYEIEDSSTNEVSARESSRQERGEENSLESVLPTEKIADENTAPYIKCRKRCRSDKSSQGNSRDASPEINTSTEENLVRDERTSEIIMDQNIKPKISYYYTDSIRNKNGCFVKTDNNKRTLLLQLKLAAQSLTKVSLDSKPSVRQISSDKRDQENTCSLYHRLSAQKNPETNTEAKNSDGNNIRSNFEKHLETSEKKSASETKSLEAEKKSPRSDIVTRIIDDINSELSETPKRRNRSTKVPEANVQKLSTESTATLKESAQDIAEKISNDTKLVSEKIVKENIDEKILLEASLKENLPHITEKTSEGSELLPLKIAEDEEPRIPSSPKKRVRRRKNPKLSCRKSSPEKRAQDIAKKNSERFDSSPVKIVEKNPEGLVRVRRKHRSRKISESCTEEAIPLDDESTQNTVKNNSETLEESSLLSQRIREEDVPEEIPQLSASILSTEKISQDITKEIFQRLESSPQKIAEESTEPEICVKAKKRRRSRKIADPNLQKPSVEAAPSIDESARVTDEKASKIPEESKLSQKLEEEESESKSLFKAKSSELDASKLYPASMSSTEKSAQRTDDKRPEVFSRKIEEDDFDSKNLVNTSLQQISTDETYNDTCSLYLRLSQKTAKANAVGNNKSDISVKNPELNAQMPSPQSELSTKASTQNIEEKSSSEANSALNSAENNVESKMSLKVRNSEPNDREPSSESKSSPVVNTQSTVEEVYHENNLSLPNRADAKSMISVEPRKRDRSRKRRQDNAQKSFSLEEGDQDNDENSQKAELLPQTIEEGNVELKNTAKRRGRFEKNPESNVQKVSTEENSKSTTRPVSVSLEKTLATPRRGRSGKTTESNSVEPESIEENAEAEKPSPETELLAREDAETKTPVSPKRRGRPAKNTKSNSQSKSSESNDLNTADKASKETEILQQKITEEHTEVPSVTSRRRGRPAKRSQKTATEKSNHDIADKTLQEPESLLQRIPEQPVEAESVNAKKKVRSRKISRVIADEPSQESTSSLEETAQKTSREIESSSQKLEEVSEPKTPVTPKRRAHFAKNPEDTPKLSAEEASLVVAPKIVENAAEPKTLAKSKKRTRSEKSPEAKSENSGSTEETARKISDETLPEANSSTQKITKEMLKLQTLVRPQKRVHFDEESIRECAIHLRSFKPTPEDRIAEPSPSKQRKYSETTLNREPSPTRVKKTKNTRISKKLCKIGSPRAASLRRDLTTLRDNQNRQQKKDHAGSEGNNGVAEKSKCSISFSDNASLDLTSLQDEFTRQRRHNNIRGIPTRVTKARAQEQTTQSDERLPSTKTQLNDLEIVGRTKKIQWQSVQRATAVVQLQEPKIILKRLSRDTLRTYDFEFNAKNKTFVKNFKNHRPDPDYQVPAYDGAADFSSSDSDDDPADVTVAREEKRVCAYQSGKKAANTRRDAIVTPRKRKFDEAEETHSPTRKHSALATPGSSSKTQYCSPNRRSMLKSPGRVSGYYPPLQIIVTSPKVRKETSEPRDTDVRLENRDGPASTGACFTPRRKNDQRLHENLLRGRIVAMKSPRNDLGDKRAPAATMGSQRSGELDEIKSSEQSERNALKTSTITSQCSEATGTHNLTFRDGKDVRKKLVFSTAGDERRNDATDATDKTPNAGLDHQSTNLRMSTEPTAPFSTINGARESLEVVENLANRETAMLDPQPGPSRSDGVPADKNLELYEATTDEETEDDDACNVTFTQYINSQIEKNPIFTVDQSKMGVDSNEIVSLRPKFNPPSRQRIIDTMEMYGIPKYRNQEPFFSDEADVPKQKELAQKMLKVPGRGLKDLPAFVSSVEGVTGLARWRRMKINEFQPALAKSKDISAIRALVGDARVSLTPLMKPPTPKEVRNWLRAREYLEKKKKQEEMAKKTKESKEIEIQGEIAGTEEDESESNVSDLSVIEASPEKIVGGNDAGKMLNHTLKMKLAKRGLVKKAEELERNKLMAGSEAERGKDSVKASGPGEGPSATQSSNSTEMDPSLLRILEKSRLFKDQEASRHLGVSCGQIEFLSDSTRSNVGNENLRNVKALTRYQYLTIMCLEVHVATRGDLRPDAQHDSIAAIFYSVQSDVPPTSNIKPLEHGVIIVADEEKAKNKMRYSYASNIPWSISFANNEEALLNALVTLITRTDPEILIGWELETLSWGYVFQRASRLGMNLSKRISRIPATQCKWEAPGPDVESVADVKLPGRIVLDIWRIMRHEAALLSYTFESMMHHILNERVPCPSFKILTDWWNLERPRPSRWRVVEHYSLRVLGVFRMLDHLDIIGRTSELARLFGIQFYEVFSRGSQYRVESVMHRLAKPLNYIAVSPTPLQRASMRAMEALPLIMEPESMFYSDPLIVLDFQSLYPSIIIAHNYCFSTCLGRVEHIGQPQPFEFGAYTLRVSKSTALKLQDKVNFAPCGVAYVKPEVRLGILPRMLTEILETRFMVKKAMKDHKKADKTLQRALHSRQLGLKFLANVTYGYTAANFSGRMPCIEVGDSVISKSKETLERAIKLVEATPKWGARVVYGDTDSLFILVPGRSKADAFVIGNEIADAVTASNPPPIKLKFEKVMYPSILQTKKRYCGYMYETPEQETPTYLAKGIETVRRDGCPAVSKILEKTLKILFETKDVSLVKKFVTRQLDKVFRGKVSIQDLTFAKEFRGLKGYKAKACVPALELTRRLMRKDPRAVPRNSERVRYVIVAGAPNQALIHCVRTPWEIIDDPGLRPNAIYYVTRVIIPPLNRCLNLMGVDVNAWYREMPHRQILDNPVGQPVDKQKLTIFQYFGTIVCVSCGQPSSRGICSECLACPADTLVVLHEKLRWLHRTYDHVTAICQSCVGQADVADCSSLDCPILYRRAQARRELSQANHLRSIIKCGNNLEF